MELYRSGTTQALGNNNEVKDIHKPEHLNRLKHSKVGFAALEKYAGVNGKHLFCSSFGEQTDEINVKLEKSGALLYLKIMNEKYSVCLLSLKQSYTVQIKKRKRKKKKSRTISISSLGIRGSLNKK